MPKKSADAPDWHFTILTAPGGPITTALVDDEILPGRHTRQDAAGVLAAFGQGEKKISGASIQKQWSETIGGLMETVNSVSTDPAGKWEVSEVTVGLTLSTEGQLLFIAKGSAEASIELKLTKVAKKG